MLLVLKWKICILSLLVKWHKHELLKVQWEQRDHCSKITVTECITSISRLCQWLVDSINNVYFKYLRLLTKVKHLCRLAGNAWQLNVWLLSQLVECTVSYGPCQHSSSSGRQLTEHTQRSKSWLTRVPDCSLPWHGRCPCWAPQGVVPGKMSET